MVTKEVRKSEEEITQIQLTKGEFSPTDASQIILNLLNEKINFHRIQRHQIWEGDHQCNTKIIDQRIEELENEITKAKALILKAKEQGLKLKIDGSLKITLLENPKS